MTGDEAVERARTWYLDDRNIYGCAETTFIVLKEAFGIENPLDSSAAMALNGGIAYGGSMCGPICGSAMALGMLAERRIGDHLLAKSTARGLTQRLMDDFRREYGAVNCRELIGIDLRAPGEHERFIAGEVWRTGCMRQIEWAVRRLAPLADEAEWERAVREVARARV